MDKSSIIFSCRGFQPSGWFFYKWDKRLPEFYYFIVQQWKLPVEK